MKDIKVLHQQAQLALNQQNYQLAHQLIIEILQLDKFFADGYFLLAMIASSHNNQIKALTLIDQAHRLAPSNNEYIAYLAKHYAIDNQAVKAVQTLTKLNYSQAINNALTLDTIGVAFSKIGLHQSAVKYFKQAVALNPNNANFHFNLAASLKFIGEIKPAKQAYETTIKLKPSHYKAHLALAGLGDINADNNHIKQLNELFQQANQVDDKLYLGHALAKEYEALQQYDQSFAALLAAKAKKLKSLDYTLAQDQSLFHALEQHFKIKPTAAGHPSSEAIFVVGMPRTGTTLVERILSKHSDVTSVGELQNFGLLFKQMCQTTSNRVIDAETINASQQINYQQLGLDYIQSTRALTGTTAKFVDKMPLNFLYVGFILQALPNAKIVCLDRQPIDTIISNFKQLFAVNQSYYNYSYSLAWTTEFYQMFKKLIQLWQVQYPDNFYLVNYEELVNLPEINAKKLVEFTGLTWQPQCLEIDKNTSPVATASAVQVRQPINNKSVGFWQNYRAYLAETISQLEDV
ncbi:MAG: tetratricopeptide repeat-containing sulfotransferase family protein [Thalassotalea sp.]